MPSRKIPLISGEIYHVFNRSVAKQPIFNTKRDYSRFVDAINYYKFLDTPFRFSHFFRMDSKERASLMGNLKKTKNKSVQILAFCIMPNHFHLLARQLEDNGILTLIKNIQNSYAKYFNIKYKRTGALFQEQFKAVHLESDEQLLHVCRYIHLNPLTAYIVKNLEDMISYPWSSLRDYLGDNEREIISTSEILAFFNSKEKDFLKFNGDQENYQKVLGRIKHLILE